MPTFKFTAPNGKQYSVVGPDGATEQQAFQMLQSQLGAPAAAAPAPAKPFGQQMNDAIADVPRQLGLTARYGIEGIGDMANLVTSPIRAGLNAVLPRQRSVADVITGAPGRDAIGPMNFPGIADAMNLPTPQNAKERIVGDAARMVAGGVVPIAAASRVAQGTTGVTKAVAEAMAARPLQQIASAGAAGAAGGSVRESGGNAGSQLIASLAAGVGAPYAMGKAQQAGAGIRQLMNGRAQVDPAQIEIQINRALQPSGINLAQLAPDVQAGIRNDVSQALRMSDDLAPDALRRLVDYRITGTTPTVGKLTRDPAQFTQEENLMRIGANSKDTAAQQLGAVKNTNNRQLIDLMNTAGANTADTALTGAQKVIGALDKRNTRATDLISDHYAAARATDGRSAALDPHAFTTRANDLLDEALLGGKLPTDVKNLLNKAASGEMPLTVDTAEQFKTRIGDLQRATIDKSEKKALGLVRSALDETPLLPGQEIGQESIDAFNKARSLHRAWMGIVEKTPALQAVRDGIEPDKFVQQFITGGGPQANVADLAALRRSIKDSPEAMTAVKEQITSHLKNKALSGAADEVGGVSQAAYNKALNAIGDPKLAMFFTKPEIDQLRAIGRVASYEQVAPAGAFPNRSNTAGAIAGILDRIAGSALVSKVPFARMALQQPAENIVIGMKAKGALNAPAALVGQSADQQLLERPAGVLLSPAVVAGDRQEKE